MALSKESTAWRAYLSRAIIGATIGAVGGIAGYTFVYAKGYSYMLNDPAACANCHIMREQFDGWNHSSHRSVATCNDCHTPHDFLGKYMTKARNGFWHSYYFTANNFPEPIRMEPKSRAITEAACRHCHGPLVQAMDTHSENMAELSCTRCHESVGHVH